jgi:DNA helicase II / ATP-dependent DNA helicase PcrA
MYSTYQQEIIQSKQKRISVQASPGSGKTHTLLHRIAHLIVSGVPARKILVLSFSNDAISELHRRRDELCTTTRNREIAEKFKQVQITTTHSFALSVVRQISPSLKILADRDALKLLVQAIRSTLADTRAKTLWQSVSLNVRKQRVGLLRELLKNPREQQHLLAALAYTHAANLTASTTLSTGQFEPLKRYIRVVNSVAERYSTAKKNINTIDFGDMVAEAKRLLLEKPGMNTFKHVLADEYQDSSPAQVQLLQVLAEVCRCHITVFGDRHQAIYGFGGNVYTPLEDVLAGVRVMSLPDSHRLTRQTAALASAVVQHKGCDSIRAARDGTSPVLVINKSMTEQAKAVAADIQRLIAAGTPPSQIAVLARAGQWLHPIEQALLATSIQTSRAHTERDARHCMRVLILVRLTEHHEAKGRSIDAMTVQHILRKAKPCLDEDGWAKVVKLMKKAIVCPSVEGRYKRCIDIYLLAIGGARKNTVIKHDLNRWIPLCRGRVNARAVLEAVTAAERPAAVNTGTIHSAKGREWQHVFVVGLADGQLPLYLVWHDATMLAEERRLLYVAITRARTAVRLFFAPTSHSLSRQRFETVSRFLVEKVVRRMLAQVAASESSLHRPSAIRATYAIRATPAQKSAALANLSVS